MKTGDLIAGAFLAFMVLVMFMFSDRGDQEVRAIRDRLDSQDSKISLMTARTIPQITIEGRAAVYAGSGDITVEKIEK